MVRAHRKRRNSSSGEDDRDLNDRSSSVASFSTSSATWRAKRLAQKHKRNDVEVEHAGQEDDDFWSRMATSLPQTRDFAQDDVARPIEQQLDDDKQDLFDHPSDLEGNSDLDESEKAVFISQRRQERRQEKRKMTEHASRSHKEHLEEMQRKRLAALSDTAKESEETIGARSVPASTTKPTQAMFELMQRTAAALSNSPNPMQLEMKIYANHGNDPRFAFLRDDVQVGEAREAWLRLRSGEEIKWEDVVRQQEGSSGIQATLLSGYDSDSDISETGADEDHAGIIAPQDSAQTEDQTCSSPDATSSNPTTKQEERRARAREWAASQRATRAADDTSSSPQQEPTQQDPSSALSGKEKFALEQKERVRRVAEKAKEQAQQKAASMRLVEMDSEDLRHQALESDRVEEDDTFDLMDGATEDSPGGDGNWGHRDDVLRIG